MSVARVSVLAIPVVIGLASLASAGPVLGAVCDGAGTSLANGSFETPVVAADTYSLLPAADVPPWQTTDELGEIELWGTGFLGVPAFEGNAFAELNANSSGTLYQDVVSTPGSTLTWTLAHRAREGDDTMVVLLGDANTADVSGSAGWGYTSSDLTDGVDAWGIHSDSYLVPAGQTCTRLAFRAVSAGSGSDSVGNFLDAVDFAVIAPPTPTPTPTPTATPTPTPTPTATPTPTPTPTATPTPTPTPTATPTSTPTPSPTSDPQPTPVPSQGAAAAPTAPPTDRGAPAVPAADGSGLAVAAVLAAIGALSITIRRLDERLRRGS